LSFKRFSHFADGPSGQRLNNSINLSWTKQSTAAFTPMRSPFFSTCTRLTNLLQAGGILLRFIEGGVTGNRGWIERYNISERRH
jgi:hypothetical protein